MPFTNFPQGFAAGLSVRGMPLLQAQPGQIFWVTNSPILNPNQKGGSDGNRGTFLDPFATLQNALNLCVDGRGDIIMVGPGHIEILTTATQLALNGASVAIVGLGSGAMRPQFIFGTANTTTINVSAANVSIQNCVFVGNFLSIAACFTAVSHSFTASISGNVMTVTAGTLLVGDGLISSLVTPGTIVVNQLTGTANGVGTYTVNYSQTAASGTITTGPQEFLVDSCEFRDNSAVLGFLTVLTGTSTTSALNGLTMTNNRILSQSTVSVTCAIVMTSGCDRVSLRDNYGNSPITTGTQGPALLATGANSITNFDCGRNRFFRPNTSTTLPVGISTSGTAWTGHCYDNYFWSLNSGTGIWISTGTKLGFTNNYSPITGAADKSALINPVAV